MEPTLTAYGTWSGGRFMNFGEKLDEERYLAAIRHAYDRGIRTFMTADVYGVGESDRLLGKALAGLPRDSYCLVGAIGHDFYEGKRNGAKGFQRFTDPALRGEADYASYLRMATEKSLERIGTSRFDLLLLHNPDEIGYTSAAIWDGMAALRSEGLSEKIGIAPGPANGFVLDMIGAYERFDIDWAMIILSPFEPWPGGLTLAAAEKHGVKVITRVVDHGGIFHDDVKPGHTFNPIDHRAYRPAGWVETGNRKLEELRPFAERHGLTLLQLASAWNLAHTPVKSVIPTLIQEAGENTRTMESKIDELAALEEKSLSLSPEEVAAIRAIGNNHGCMDLKGANPSWEGEPVADGWGLNEALLEVASRWEIDPARDLLKTM